VQRITTGPRDFGRVEVSPNGQQVLLASTPFQQEDLYLLTPNGGALMHLTQDRARDRAPKFSPDGRRVYFYTDHGGMYDVWSINSDGSGLRQLTKTDGRYYPVPSPDGARLLVSDINNLQLFVLDANDPSKALEALPPFPPALRGSNFVPQDWSPDGKTIAGVSGAHVWTYSFEAKEYREVTSGGNSPQWFGDNRRLLLTLQGRVSVLDSSNGQVKEVFGIPGEPIVSAKFSSDGWLYFVSGNASGDIWVVRFGDGGQAAATP
jgi:Tol biopolymer transport system component